MVVRKRSLGLGGASTGGPRYGKIKKIMAGGVTISKKMDGRIVGIVIGSSDFSFKSLLWQQGILSKMGKMLIVNRIDPPYANKIDPPESNNCELVVM
jgi:hypothetical protein